MTATVIPFPYNDQPRSDEQRGHVQPPTDLMEAWAIWEAAGLWVDAKDPVDRATAMRRMTRILQYGSPAASEVVSRWLDNVLGPAVAGPNDCNPSEGAPEESWRSDYAD